MRRAWCGIGTAVGALALLTGCADYLGDFAPFRARPPYQAGYVLGCQYGLQDAGAASQLPERESRYDHDPEYRRGWDDGHKDCYEDFLRAPSGPVNPV